MKTPRLEGLDRTEAPWWRHRTTIVLAVALIFAAGFFSGAILFGTALLYAR